MVIAPSSHGQNELAGLDEAGDRGHAGMVGLDEYRCEPDALLGRLCGQFRAAAQQRDEYATGADAGKGALQTLAAEWVQDDIDVTDGFGDIGGAVVDDLVGAETAQEVVPGPARG